ncbi:hypothetical protein Leryth_013741 [Lithospermum erythrorhizon]|nr:hypothetical protein Leryth_013741 [Lithospermum erythrorhizon]
MSSLAPNLLDEALGFDVATSTITDRSDGCRRVILIEDSVETSGAFVLHHFIKRTLSPLSSDVVIFLSFSHSFSHYDRVLRKMGCNLVQQTENKRFLFFDLLKFQCKEGNVESVTMALYGKVHKALEICCVPDTKTKVLLVIDDISLMEVATNGSSNQVLDFLHYCHSLTSQFGCSLVILDHEDIYTSTDLPTLLLRMECLADTVIKAEPLGTGLAADVHGQLTVLNKGVSDVVGKNRSKSSNFHFKIKENNVEYFYPGSRT